MIEKINSIFRAIINLSVNLALQDKTTRPIRQDENEEKEFNDAIWQKYYTDFLQFAKQYSRSENDTFSVQIFGQKSYQFSFKLLAFISFLQGKKAQNANRFCREWQNSSKYVLTKQKKDLIISLNPQYNGDNVKILELIDELQKLKNFLSSEQ